MTVRASQPGDATYAAASPVDQTLTVSKASSAIAISTSANPVPTGSNVTFTAIVTSTGGTPTGAAQFLSDGTALGAPVGLSGGSASVSSSTLAHGTHVITARYPGDANFLGSTNSLSPNQAVNASPIASADSLQRYKRSGVKTRISTLLANDLDPDHDVLALSSAGPLSPVGGSIAVGTRWVFYTPPTGYTNADTFSYVVADSGGLQSTGSVTISIGGSADISQNLMAIQALGGGAALIQFQAIAGRTYTIEYQDNLQTPSWQFLGTGTADATGRLQITDPTAAGRFYRCTFP